MSSSSLQLQPTSEHKDRMDAGCEQSSSHSSIFPCFFFLHICNLDILYGPGRVATAYSTDKYMYQRIKIRVSWLGQSTKATLPLTFCKYIFDKYTYSQFTSTFGQSCFLFIATLSFPLGRNANCTGVSNAEYPAYCDCSKTFLLHQNICQNKVYIYARWLKV